MNRRALLIGAAGALFAGGGAQALDAGDRTIVPGMRVGAIVKATPPADLAKIYGADRVRYAKVPVAEGDEVAGAFVLRGTADELQAGFTEDGKRIEFIRIIGRNWKTESGIRIGTGLAELERLNGRPFTLSGFDWDYGGQVFPAAPGKLPKGLAITVQPRKSEAVPPRDYNKVSGDRKISSRHPVLAKIDVAVTGLVVTFAR